MNYDEARQLGAESTAPGRWNWTTMNDGIIRTAPPCAWPDFDWDAVSPMDAVAGTVKPTGRERCDHETREEAERHHWSHELARIRIDPIDLDSVRDRHRCDVPDCKEWETQRGSSAWLWPHLCDAHADRAGLELVYPFHEGAREIHS